MSMVEQTSAERARELVRGYAAQAENALDPYILTTSQRFSAAKAAGEIHGPPAELLEQLGISQEQVEEAMEQAMQESPVHTAVAEILVDLQHYCMQHGIDFKTLLQAAGDRFGVEMRAAARATLYDDQKGVDLLKRSDS